MTVITSPVPADDDTEPWEVREEREEREKRSSFGLVQRVQAGDRAAFGEIYQQNRPVVFKFVYCRVGNRPLAEDLTQETFARALQRIHSFRWMDRNVGAWLVTIAKNLLVDHFKSSRYQREVVANTGAGSSYAGRESSERGPEQLALDYLTSRELAAALLLLTDEQREVLVLRFLRGLDVAETAAAMDRHEGAVKAMQYRAVRSLARIARAQGWEPAG